MLKAILRPSMIFIPLIAGLFLPELHVMQWSMRWIIVIMLYLTTLNLKLDEIKFRKSHLAVLGTNLFMGIVPFLLVKFLKIGDDNFALSLFFVGITPTANAAPVIISFLGGNVGFVLTSFVVTNIIVSLAILVLLPLFTGQTDPTFIIKIAENLFFLILIPVLASTITRWICPISSGFKRATKHISFSLWCYLLLIISAVAMNNLRNNVQHENLKSAFIIGCGSFILCGLNFGVGYLVGGKEYKRESSQSLGQKNTTLTMYLALVLVNPLVALGPIFYILWHNLYNGVQIFFYELSNQKAEKLEKKSKNN